MLKRINREKFMFEIIWLVLLAVTAISKFWQEIYGSELISDYVMMGYTTIVYVIPNIVNSRFCMNIYLYENENRNVKSNTLKNNIKAGYELLSFSFWVSIVLNLFIFLMIGQLYGQFIFTKKVVFIIMLVNYGFTFFVGVLTKFLTYFNSSNG